MKKIIHAVLCRHFYTQTPLWDFERKTFVYLVQWELFKLFFFKKKYLTYEELVAQGITPKK